MGHGRLYTGPISTAGVFCSFQQELHRYGKWKLQQQPSKLCIGIFRSRVFNLLAEPWNSILGWDQ